MTRYLGKVCDKHPEAKGERYQSSRKCVQCNKEHVKVWREANSNKEKGRLSVWREANKDKESERKKIWREANKDKVKEYQKAWREGNKINAT